MIMISIEKIGRVLYLVKKEYRIIKNNYRGYEVQHRYKWFPFIWFQTTGIYGFWHINSFMSMSSARNYINKLEANE